MSVVTSFLFYVLWVGFVTFFSCDQWSDAVHNYRIKIVHLWGDIISVYAPKEAIIVRPAECWLTSLCSHGLGNLP